MCLCMCIQVCACMCVSGFVGGPWFSVGSSHSTCVSGPSWSEVISSYLYRTSWFKEFIYF